MTDGGAVGQVPPRAPRVSAGRSTGAGTGLLAATAGLLTAALTLATGHLAAAVLDPQASPLPALGDAFIDLTPEWLKELAIAAFGVHDKTALLVGMVLVVAVVAALTGLLAVRRIRAAQVVVLGLGLVAAAAAAGRPQTGSLAVLPSLVGAVVGVVALPWLVRRAAPAGTGLPEPTRAAPTSLGGSPGPTRETALSSAGPRPGQGPDRRGFLRAAGLATVGAALAAAAGTVATGAKSTARAIRRIVLPAPARPAPPVPADAQAPVDGVVPVVTPSAEFYRIDTAFTVPQVDPDTWRLRVHGMVEREVTLTLDDLLAADLVEAYVTLTCVSNAVGGNLAGNARWLGLPVREVLATAGPLAGADMVLSRSADGFTASTPIEALTDDRDALLAVGMNGDPLPAEHGFPVRMVVPGLYGYVSATKWLVDLEVTRFADAQAYWTERGWAERGPVKIASRVEVPRSGASVAAGPVDVGGTAWAQHTGIASVQVQVDDEPWQDATLAGEISVDTWRQWSWRWPDAVSGRHLVRVRAVGKDGTVQPGEHVDSFPDGAEGWHEVSVFVQ